MVLALIVTLDLAVRSLSERFVNLDVALLHPGNVAHSLETNSNGYRGVKAASQSPGAHTKAGVDGENKSSHASGTAHASNGDHAGSDA